MDKKQIKQLRNWVSDNEEFLFLRNMRDFKATVDKKDAKQGRLGQWVAATNSLVSAAALAGGKGLLAALDGAPGAGDALNFCAAALSMAHTHFLRAFRRAAASEERRLRNMAENMQGKRSSYELGHVLNLWLSLGQMDQAKELVGTYNEMVETKLFSTSLADYCTYSVTGAARFLQMQPPAWPEDAEQPEKYMRVLREWPRVSEGALRDLADYHALGFRNPQTFEPGWEWVFTPFKQLPVELLALGRMLPSVKEMLPTLKHPLLDPWATLDLKPEHGPMTELLTQIEQDFNAMIAAN